MTNEQRILNLMRDQSVLRSRDLTKHAIPRKYIQSLLRKGLVERISRGTYRLADADVSEHHDLAMAAKIVPGGVICLLSALRFHDIGTQNPYEVWIAVSEKARTPKSKDLGFRFMRFSGVALTYGVEEHTLDGVQARVYSSAKTVADCFKYRNKIGLDVAIEALRDCWRQRKATMDELWEAAKVCRVATVMRPYLESLV